MSAVHIAELVQGSMGVAGLVSQLRAQWTLGDEREGGITRECPLGDTKACERVDLKVAVYHSATDPRPCTERRPQLSTKGSLPQTAAD